MKPPTNYLLTAPDDGLPAPEVGPWAVEKYRRLGMYSAMFATGMKNRWGTRVYLDLFAGPGHAIINDHHFRNNDHRVLSSPLIALSLPDLFDRYIFCDRDRQAIDALTVRANRLATGADLHFVLGDVNAEAATIEALIPRYAVGHTVLSLCVLDPWDLGIHFETVTRLGEPRAMDFIILLATDMDGRRNWETYLDPRSLKVARFLGDDRWRGRWAEAESESKSPAQFLAEEYAVAMKRIGYMATPLDRMIPIRTYANNMRLYYLAFFSKSEQGFKFWDQVRKYSSDQVDLL